MISCILTIMITVSGQSYETQKEFTGKRLRSDGDYWIMDFSEETPKLSLPIKVKWQNCEKV